MGMSMANFEADYTLTVVDEGEYSESVDKDDTSFAMQFIAGVNFEIMPNISFDLAYKYLGN